MIALLALLLSIPVDIDSDGERPLSCGQAACYLLLSQLGNQVTLDNLDREFDQLQSEASFADLQQTLNRFGVDSSVWHVSWVEFQRIQGPMICHLTVEKSGLRHFHVAEWQGSELVVFDSMAAHPIRITADRVSQYQEAFSGNVLVPSSGTPFHWRLSLTPGKFLTLGSLGLLVAAAIHWSLQRRRQRRAVATHF